MKNIIACLLTVGSFQAAFAGGAAPDKECLNGDIVGAWAKCPGEVSAHLFCQGQKMQLHIFSTANFSIPRENLGMSYRESEFTKYKNFNLARISNIVLQVQDAGAAQGLQITGQSGANLPYVGEQVTVTTRNGLHETINCQRFAN
jgi:hypothetical protein